MQELRESVLAAEAALGSRGLAWDAVLATVAGAHGLGRPGADQALAPWRDPAAASSLGAVHESLVAGRGESGAFYTPPSLVDWVLDRALADTGTPSVLDPACGTGNFLLAALRRLGPAAVERLHGVDLDPVAVAITRLLIRIEAPDVDPALLEQTIRVGDGLGEHPAAPYDAVVGNPPFLGQLRTRTAGQTRPGLGPYTDTSAAFLHRALDLVRPGGTVALVQPWSLLAARDAAPVRAAVRSRGALTAFWASATPVFADAAVLTCAPVVTVGARQGGVATWTGPAYQRGPDVAAPDAEWGPLVAPALGVPAVSPSARGVVGDLGPCTADFRDQYYGLVPFVSDGGSGTPLVTAGLIDPAVCRWGRAPTRFAKTRYAAPVVDLEALRAEGSLSAWAGARLVPKVLIATQGRVIEAVVDEAGAWLPSVPVLTLTPGADRLWHTLAVLLAPPVVALAAARYAGTALTASAIKLSARQVAALPLPADLAAWDAGADLARAAQAAADTDRPALLRATAEAMCAAYDDDSALAWWLERLRTRVHPGS